MNKLATSAIGWAERGLIPDTLVRAGIRSLLKERLSTLPTGISDAVQAATKSFVADTLTGGRATAFPCTFKTI
jgi:cyclopropane-fatty-acyl-phospholipid synthase